MSEPPRNSQPSSPHGQVEPDEGLSARPVVVVDGDHLTRWSISRYLERSCPVASADSLARARHKLDQRPAAVVIGDVLPDGNPDEIINEIHVRFPGVTIVKLTSQVADRSEPPVPHVAILEKPFLLHRLGELLGINPAVSPLSYTSVGTTKGAHH